MARETGVPVSSGLFLALAFLLLTNACTATSSLKSQIVGKWQEVNGTEVLQFYGDGTYDRSSGEFFSLTWSGTYSFPDNQHLRLTPKSSFFQQEFTVAVQISGGRLGVTSLNGQVTEYQRVQ